MFGLFKKKENKLSKSEYWKKWGIFELIADLHTAEKSLSNRKGGFSGNFVSAEEFHAALIDKIDDIEFDNQTDLSVLWAWFVPTSAWDDFMGSDGEIVGNRIFARLDKWMKHNR